MRSHAVSATEGVLLGLPEFVQRLLGPKLGPYPYCVFLSKGKGHVAALFASRFELAADDPLTYALADERLWRSVAEDRLTRLADVAHPGLSAADRNLWLQPVGLPERFLGGLLLLRPAGAREADLASRAQDPDLRALLTFVLEHFRLTVEHSELGEFRAAVAEALPYGFMALDALGRVRYAGGRASAILGLSESDLAGSDCARVFRPVGLPSHPMLDALKQAGSGLELFIVRPDGREVPLSLRMARPPRAKGQPRALLTFFQDVSEERALEDAERQKDRLVVLGELSAGVAHEIRNPLTGIANCAQVLSEGLPAEDEKRQRFLKIIMDETARLNRIVEGLLNYARPNRPELREVSVEECVRRSLDLVRGGLEEKGIGVQVRVSGRIPRTYIDPPQITQVLLNLFRNAEEAMPQGGELSVELQVIRRHAHRRRGPGRRATDRARLAPGPAPMQRFVQIRVTDTGHGIPRELLPRICNPFFTTRTRGTGLGLSLSQSIVREHGGVLTVHSVENKGTTVQVDLPVERRQGERRKDPRRS